MDYFTLLVLILSFAWTCFYVITTALAGRKSSLAKKLPPGPCPLPIVGNIFKLGNKPHQALADLSDTYGPIMTLKLGSLTTIVMSSPYTAKEVLHKHDRALSTRSVPVALHAKDHYMNSMAWLPPEAHWKNLRKVGVMHLFTAQRLDASQALRQKKVQELLDYVLESCRKGEVVNIGQALFTTSLNLMSNTLFSIDLAEYHSVSSQSFSDIIRGLFEESGRPNLADYFIILRVTLRCYLIFLMVSSTRGHSQVTFPPCPLQKGKICLIPSLVSSKILILISTFLILNICFWTSSLQVLTQHQAH